MSSHEIKSTNIWRWFIPCYFTMQTSSTHVIAWRYNNISMAISSSLRVNTSFHEISKLNIKTFWYFVHTLNKESSRKIDKLPRAWVICSKIFANKNDVKKNIDMITAFILQEEISRVVVAGDGGWGWAQSSGFLSWIRV